MWAKRLHAQRLARGQKSDMAMWLYHPCPLGGPQRPAPGRKSEMATWHTCGRSGYIIPAVLGFPKRAARGQKSEMAPWLKWGQSGYPDPLGGPQPLARGQQSVMATSLTSAQSGYITSTVLGVTKGPRGAKIRKWLRGPHVGKVATSPLPAWGSPTLSARTEIRNGYVAHTGAKWLHHSCYLGGPQRCLGVRNS